MRLACIGSFFFNDTATTEIYTLSLHDALPILGSPGSPAKTGDHFIEDQDYAVLRRQVTHGLQVTLDEWHRRPRDRKSTRLNSSHANISYAVFCLKKKKTTKTQPHTSYYLLTHL